jgi:hypothetical protein
MGSPFFMTAMSHSTRSSWNLVGVWLVGEVEDEDEDEDMAKTVDRTTSVMCSYENDEFGAVAGSR